MNNITILGRLTKKPTLTDNGNVQYTFFTIATQRGEHTTFIPLTAFSSTARFICSYFDKGEYILIQGHIEGGGKDKEFKISCVADQAYFCKNKNAPTGDFNFAEYAKKVCTAPTTSPQNSDFAKDVTLRAENDKLPFDLN